LRRLKRKNKAVAATNEAKRQEAIASENADKERIARNAAEEQALIVESRRLAAESASSLSKYPQRSLLLAVEAVKVGQSLHGVRVAAAEQSLREALASIGGRPLVSSPSGTAAMAFSPDNRWLVTGGSDAALGSDGQRSGCQPGSPASKSAVYVAEISPDSRWLVTGSEDSTVRLWNPNISPDSRWLVTSNSNDGLTKRLWDLRAHDPAASPVVLPSQEVWINSVRFSPDNHWLVTVGPSSAELWDLRAKDPAASPVVLPGPENSSVEFSPDYRWLVTGTLPITTRRACGI
jgi:hypothetical protein